ncbi:MAG: ribonuclease P protein component [Gammaproteobacteria bacterium]|nr:ribonuclease P protein component [Gammaproteobacteria bacterium]
MAEQFCFRRNSRLTTASEFNAVFKSNQKIADSLITLLISKKNPKQPRLGFAIAKKQIKKAVERNRLKRIFRESFRLHQTQLPDKDFVIMVRHKIQFKSNQQIFNLMKKNWQAVILKCEKF